MKLKILVQLWLLIFAATLIVNAQNSNPYKEIGKKGKTLTLTNGQFNEFFDEDDVQQIGTNLVNITTMKVVRILTEEEAAKRLDNTVGKRFLSVDPLAGKFPMLTPYQYASNRPIDGTDLDGKEWTQAISYDIMKGEFKVQLNCKIKITCSADMAVNAKAIGNAFVTTFENSLNNLYDERRKIRYSATAEYEILNGEPQSSDYTVDLFSATKTKSGLYTGGISGDVNTQSNSVSVAASTVDKASGIEEAIPPQKVALSITHELGHTGNIKHPFDPENTATDVDLTGQTQNINGKPKITFTISQGADKTKILSNIMMYGTTTIDGIKVNDMIKDPQKLSTFSAEQAFIILKQILSDKKNQAANQEPGNSQSNNTQNSN